MFILHVKHYYFQEILKISLLAKKMLSQHLYRPQARLLPANYKIFEVPVLVFASAFGNAVSAVRPWDRGCLQPWRQNALGTRLVVTRMYPK
jgi:hypothetical protein